MKQEQGSKKPDRGRTRDLKLALEKEQLEEI